MIPDLRFISLPKKKPSFESIKSFLVSEGTKRIHFATSHKGALKPGKDARHGIFQVPFYDTIGHILSRHLEGGIGNYIFKSTFDGYWRGFKSKDDHDRCKAFVEEYHQVVFLRDTLDLSLALSMNLLSDDVRTQIGEWEFQAKYRSNTNAEREISSLVRLWLDKLPFYNVADLICAMPCTNPDTPGLPRRIVNQIGKFENISDTVKWTNKDKSLKELSTVEAKLAALQEFGLEISSDLTGKNVILLDDLYMSGMSMQYVALKMKEAGADRVFGLSIVKSRSNTAL